MNELRDRIAAAIEQNLADQLPIDLPDRYYEWIGYDTLADAVIAALGLREEKGQRSNSTGPLWGSDNRHTVTRYVTEWENDE